MVSAVAGAAALAGYALLEPLRYRLAIKDVPLGRGPRLDILHLSDMHFSARDRRLGDFLRSLRDEPGEVDVVLCTGDMIQNDGGIAPLLDALEGIRGRYGSYYVLGSHDYFHSSAANYAKYFTGRRDQIKVRRNNVDDLEEGLGELGWRALTNDSVVVTAGDARIRLAGVDDPYIDRHRTEHIQSRDEDLAIGLVHAPDVVSEWMLRGFDLVVAGHTHAGQVRVPGAGAVVTNSKLPSALASGLHRIGRGWLHVSPGLGTGRFAPIRFLAPPEATLLRLNA